MVGGREQHPSVAFSCVSQLGTESAAWVRALGGSPTRDLPVRGMTLRPAEPRQPGLGGIFPGHSFVFCGQLPACLSFRLLALLPRAACERSVTLSRTPEPSCVVSSCKAAA